MISHEQGFALGVIWVGGWGFLFFNYPASICRMSRQEATPKRLRLIRIIGAIELVIVLCSAMAEFVWGFFL